jgi:uncharacterized protein YndB with AHSA1/START domain
MRDGRTIRREVRLPESPGEVWDAVTQPDRLAAWFGADAELELRPGGPVRFRWNDGTQRRGLIEAIDPPQRLVFRWRELAGTGLELRVGEISRVEFHLEPDGQGTRLTVTETPGMATEEDLPPVASVIR